MPRYLVDVNIWVALAIEDHPAHPAVRDWFLGLGPGEAAFCTFTELAFLRLLTNPALTAGGIAFTVAEAWAAHDALHRNARIVAAGEPPDLLAAVREWTMASKRLNGASWTDAYLASFARVSGLRLATLDRRLARRLGPSGYWIGTLEP